MAAIASTLPLIFSVCALILALAAIGICWYLARSTHTARHTAPGEILVRLAEIEQEWQATLEGNARFLKRLAQREKRDAQKAAEMPLETANGAAVGSKAHLREIARQRGLVR